MAEEEQQLYDASEVVSGETAAQPEQDVALPPVEPLELEGKYLLGAEFPASRGDLVAAAERNDAPSRVLGVLERVDDREYRDVGDLLGEVERTTGERRGVA